MEDEKLLTLDELCERVGMSVRNVRFYTSRGLVPPPIRKGRSGYYTRTLVTHYRVYRKSGKRTRHWLSQFAGMRLNDYLSRDQPPLLLAVSMPLIVGRLSSP